MSDNGKGNSRRIGFLTAIELPQRGYVGGLLVTNHLGRPLEFQCTAPVKPNRTQEILYGPTLVPFLLGEVIGCTLVEKATVKPDLILTEQQEILELSDNIDVPVAYLKPVNDETFHTDRLEISTSAVQLGRQKIFLHSAHNNGQEAIKKLCEAVPQEADLHEPFERVRDALHEALQAGSGAA